MCFLNGLVSQIETNYLFVVALCQWEFELHLITNGAVFHVFTCLHRPCSRHCKYVGASMNATCQRQCSVVPELEMTPRNSRIVLAGD